MGKITGAIAKGFERKYIAPNYLSITDAYKMAAFSMGTAGAAVVGTVVGTVGVVTAARAVKKVKNLEKNLIDIASNADIMEQSAQVLLNKAAELQGSMNDSQTAGEEGEA